MFNFRMAPPFITENIRSIKWKEAQREAPQAATNTILIAHDDHCHAVVRQRDAAVAQPWIMGVDALVGSTLCWSHFFLFKR